MAILRPTPIAALARRLFDELAEKQAVFDLPARRFVRGIPGADLSMRLGGRNVAIPFGPAAGPHTQLAQNLVLSWLAGGRAMELKTVQSERRASDVPRPCIDMRDDRPTTASSPRS
jgi:putative selenate reductase